MMCRLGEVMQFRNGKKRPVTNGNIPVYGGNGVLHYTDEYTQENGIIIGRVGAYCGSIFYENKKHWVSDNAISATNRENSNIIFDYYLLSNLQLNERRIGTSQPLLTQEILNSIEVDIPPLPVQRTIAATLSALDNKIANNTKINYHLEQMAQAIFFDFQEKFTGSICTIADIAAINQDTYSEKEAWEYVNYLDTSNITNGVIESVQRFVIADGRLPSRARRKVKANDIVYSTVRPNQRHFGIIAFPHDNMLVSTGFAVLRSINPAVCNEYIYLTITSETVIEQLQQLAEQSVSTFPAIKPSDLGACKITLPTLNESKELQTQLASIFQLIQETYAQSAHLATLRDTLLPRLMSGELSVTDLGDTK